MSLLPLNKLDDETRTKLVIWFVCVILIAAIMMSVHIANGFLQDDEPVPQTNMRNSINTNAGIQPINTNEQALDSFSPQPTVSIASTKAPEEEGSWWDWARLSKPKVPIKPPPKKVQPVKHYWHTTQRPLNQLDSEVNRLLSLAKTKAWVQTATATSQPTGLTIQSEQNVTIQNAEEEALAQTSLSGWGLVARNVVVLEKQQNNAVKQLSVRITPE